MNKLLIENVRCFASRQEIEIAPITVLIGENSTGKSTFLAMARLAAELRVNPSHANFNREPFFLGSFREIATSGLGNKPRAADFSIGASYPYEAAGKRPSKRNGSKGSYQQVTKFVEASAQPVAAETRLSIGEHELWVNLSNKRDPIARIRHANRSVGITKADLKNSKLDYMLLSEHLVDWNYFAFCLTDMAHEKIDPRDRQFLKELGSHIGRRGYGPWNGPYAIAPIRSKPERTYDPIDMLPKPEGDHIPMFLSRLRHEDKERWEHLVEQLNAFGREAGLFKRVGIKTLGKSLSDPFQVKINASGPISNITDVGYGVSQVLPIIVETLVRTKRAKQFLLQQPEVHLHPRGQAALASFLISRMKDAKQSFIIETHSDYFVDRLRIEIGKGDLCPDDLALLYFERNGRDTKIHRIRVDGNGNIVEPPASYRDFFMQEECRLLGL